MLETEMIDGVPEIHPQKVPAAGKSALLIDVRRPDEYNGELGHIKGAELITLGPDLEKFIAETSKEKSVVFICRSGARSARSTLAAKAAGFKDVANMTGGMMMWNALGLPVEGKTP